MGYPKCENYEDFTLVKATSKLETLPSPDRPRSLESSLFWVAFVCSSQLHTLQTKAYDILYYFGILKPSLHLEYLCYCDSN